MASLGKLNTSLIQGVNENTLALANLNFDFSLVKIQAPPEFQQIRPALAEPRRHNAEAGTCHQTARKLGALFESLVPPVPRVISAYGQRASEIMKKPGANPSGTTERHGPFAAFVGADATGIWAAATSGQASIATHLLACMLARTFSDPAKAVSVWVELVHERKQEIMAYNTRPKLSMPEIAALNASIQQVTREELRLWDASARAWLQTADSAMRKEHVQLKLVIKNLSIPVMAATSLYASVTKAWTQALVGVERLIAGEPQSVTSGAILLAISAWHLYPDLLVFTSQTTSVTFSDSLLSPSGVLTVGITNAADATNGKEGIYWSVALSHYRHYGRPIRAVSEVDDRLTMDELYVVILGGLLRSWGEPREASRKRLKSGINRHLLWKYLEGTHSYGVGEDARAVLSMMHRERSYWEETVKFLRNLAAAYEVYKKLEGATISSTIATRGIHDAEWGLAISEDCLTRSSVFSCIAAMDTGTLNLDAKRFEHIFALASGNSIYMLRHFITGPAVQVAQTDIVRIVGNVGRAGVSLLMAPASEPLMRPLSNSLRAVMYANFDGKRENNFTGTSLHLSFTPHEFPLDYGVSGIMDHQIFYVESVISVRDSGKWVADLDILQALYSGARQVLKMPECDILKKSLDHTDDERETALDSFVSIDTWEEVLDDPPTHPLVRACDDWAARLAVLAVISQNSATGPKFAADGDEESVASNEDENDDEEQEEEGEEGEKEEHVAESKLVPVRVAILESREDVCWVCMHKRLAKKGWFSSQEPRYIVV
ncbi:uncharacterized protein PG986_012937 [Apiospora aurea]|uniref:Uncharacterized protein n=1 Tax=Apiospora aurea TaxID=335848 RepID=A0ABR1Q1W3_9PEZI